MSLGRQQHVHWATLGFIQSIASSVTMCQALSTPAWIDLLLRVVADELNTPVGATSLPKQVGSAEEAFLLRCTDSQYTARVGESERDDRNVLCSADPGDEAAACSAAVLGEERRKFSHARHHGSAVQAARTDTAALFRRSHPSSAG